MKKHDHDRIRLVSWLSQLGSDDPLPVQIASMKKGASLYAEAPGWVGVWETENNSMPHAHEESPKRRWNDLVYFILL